MSTKDATPTDVGPGECKVYYHAGDEEYRAELVTGLRVPGMLVGYSQDSAEQAKVNLRELMRALGTRCDEIEYEDLTAEETVPMHETENYYR